MPENDYGELETGQTRISIASIIELASANLKNGFMENDLSQKPFVTELGLVTGHVTEIVKLAEQNGARILEELKEKTWGQTIVYLRDIDEFLLEFFTR